jgi:hypothetical protein
LRGIVNDPGGGDEQRRDDGQALFSSPVLVVQAVLAGVKRRVYAGTSLVISGQRRRWYSLFRLSLPEMKGVPKPRTAS